MKRLAGRHSQNIAFKFELLVALIPGVDLDCINRVFPGVLTNGAVFERCLCVANTPDIGNLKFRMLSVGSGRVEFFFSFSGNL